MRWCKSFLLQLAVCSFMLTSAFAANEVLTFDSDELRDRYSDLTFQLRCPKCQNQNVADSNAPIAVDIRTKTYEMLHQGYSNQEIVDFMVDRYTEFVIYKPQLSMITIWLWIVPGIVMAVGFMFLFRMTRKPKTTIDTALTEEEQAQVKALLEDKA